MSLAGPPKPHADAAVIASNRLLVDALVQQLRVLLEAVDRFEHQIAKLAPTLPDYALFPSFPGAGPSEKSATVKSFNAFFIDCTHLTASCV